MFCSKLRYRWGSFPKSVNFSEIQRKHYRVFYKMELGTVVKTLNGIAPLELAETWDNVGLLVEPSHNKTISTMMLTVDLTKPVLEEAVQKEVDMIVAYHPPIFKPLSDLRNGNWKNYIILKCIEKGIAVYSPHTALDAVEGGINDLLIHCFPVKHCIPIHIKQVPAAYPHLFDFECKAEVGEWLLPSLLPNVAVVRSSPESQGCISGTLEANDHGAQQLVALEQGDPTLKIKKIPVEHLPRSCNNGAGRWASLMNPITISEAVSKVKAFLKLESLRVSLAVGCNLGSPLRSVAVCAGSGGEVFKGVKADLLLTGEMSHHSLLDATHCGSSVILTEHSNCERFYLDCYQKKLIGHLPNINILKSTCDRDPISIL